MQRMHNFYAVRYLGSYCSLVLQKLLNDLNQLFLLFWIQATQNERKGLGKRRGTGKRVSSTHEMPVPVQLWNSVCCRFADIWRKVIDRLQLK